MKCTYECYGTDIGNGFLKINDGRTPAWSTPSWYAEVPPGSQFPNLDLYSQHVRYLDGDRPDLKGKEWLIGPAAKSQTRLFQRAVDAGKIDISLQLVLGCIRPPQEMTESGTLFTPTDGLAEYDRFSPTLQYAIFAVFTTRLGGVESLGANEMATTPGS